MKNNFSIAAEGDGLGIEEAFDGKELSPVVSKESKGPMIELKL